MVSKKKFFLYALIDVLANVFKAARTTYYKKNPYLSYNNLDTTRQLTEMAKGVYKGVESGYNKAKEETLSKPKINISVRKSKNQ